ncbi:MAG: hypothetical protein JO358_19305 [Alphaproteobacteria bacterium]|nr:hypothetical protein [Alphaproteobacteria bacterium]
MSRYLLSQCPNAGDHGRLGTPKAHTARSLPRRGRGISAFAVLQLLGVWAAAWAALASAYAWLH